MYFWGTFHIGNNGKIIITGLLGTVAGPIALVELCKEKVSGKLNKSEHTGCDIDKQVRVMRKYT